VQPDGKIVAGGVFTAVNGTPRDGLARLNPNGSVDTTFAPTGFAETNGRPVRGLGFQSNGMLIAAGRFTLGTNLTRRPLIRLNTNGVADSTFVTSFTGTGSSIRAAKVLPDDRIVAVDDKVYRFNPDGAADSGFVPDLLTDQNGHNTAALVYTFAVQSDGKVVFAGIFSFVGNQRRDGVARLNTDGSLDSFDVGRIEGDRFPQRVFVQSNGKILVASDFGEADGAVRMGLARFNHDGRLDQSFDPASVLGTNSVIGEALQPDDKLFLAASVDPSGLGSTIFARLNADGTLDANFHFPFWITEFGDAFALQDGKILLLAANNYDLLSDPTTLILRLNYDGSSDNSFHLDPSFNQTVIDTNTMLVTALYAPGPKPLLQLPGGKLLVASFTTNLQFRLTRINNDGSLDNSFTPGVVPAAMPFVGFPSDFSVENIGFFDAALQADGKLLVVGQFTNYNGSARNGIVRLNADGSVDSSFDAGPGPQWVTIVQTSTNLFPRIESVRLVSGNKILVAGNFDAFSGAPFNGLARLNPDGSVDTNFFAGLVRRNFSLFPRGPAALVQEPDGNFLLTGQFSRPGQSAVLTLSRLLMRPSLEIAKGGPTNSVLLSLSGGADRFYTIQATTNLVDWTNLTNLINTNDIISFSDSPLFRSRFCRAVSQP
jgi:uncharacterized delta-60 repeat protein